MTLRPLTIGELARRLHVSTSMLRFYEREGLLTPERRTAAGYRLYPPSAEKTLLFIRRAQRLGFSLNDIKVLLAGGAGKDAGKGAAGGESRGVGSGNGRKKAREQDPVVGIAEERFLDIERRLTELLVLRHELEFFLADLTERINRNAGASASRLYRDLLDQVCGHDTHHRAPSALGRLTQRLGCSLASSERDQLFAALRGRHLHVWREDDGYSILVIGRDPAVEAALRRLAASEAHCTAHVEPHVAEAEEGYLFQARGANAFLFAQLFLGLEAAEA